MRPKKRDLSQNIVFLLAFLQFSGTLYCRERVLKIKKEKTNKLGKNERKRPTIGKNFDASCDIYVGEKKEKCLFLLYVGRCKGKTDICLFIFFFFSMNLSLNVYLTLTVI